MILIAVHVATICAPASDWPHPLRRQRSAKVAHDLVANGLDDGAAELVRRILHDFEAMGHSFAGLGIAEFVVDLRTANNIGKQNRDFQVFSHPGCYPVTPIDPNTDTPAGPAGIISL